MKHEPRPAIFMEKQLGRACNLGGAESLGIPKGGQSVVARLMESQISHELGGSVARGFRQGTMASAHLDSRLFSFSLYATSSLSRYYPSAGAQRE